MQNQHVVLLMDNAHFFVWGLLQKSLDSVKKMNEVISLSDGLVLIRMAWEKVTAFAISNCWKHGGFLSGPTPGKMRKMSLRRQ